MEKAIKNFALIGAAGFIAPRHMKAIKETKNNLLASLDKNDSVGIIDSYYPDCHFFTEFERFDRHLEKLKKLGEENRIHYVSICSPNYLHDAHIRFALRVGAFAICEKPLVLNPWNIDALIEIEKEFNKKVYTIFQLRHHPSIISLKEKVHKSSPDKKYNIDLTYITSRGKWYFNSWKGDVSKSGGVATNIGIHFFDMLIWIFGTVKQSVVHVSTPARAAGFLELERANVRWFLSIDRADLPFQPEIGRNMTYRSVLVDKEEFEFSEGFGDLHTIAYSEILKEKGFGLIDAKPSINLVYSIRNSNPVGLEGDFHPFLKRK